MAIDEYRFQVELNWKRFQYFFVLSAALLAAAVGLSGRDREPAFVVVLLLTGALVSLLAIIGGRSQHEYYRSARDLKGRLEDALEPGEYSLRTTGGMGGVSRGPKLVTVQAGMMAGLHVAHLVGAVAVIF